VRSAHESEVVVPPDEKDFNAGGRLPQEHDSRRWPGGRNGHRGGR